MLLEALMRPTEGCALEDESKSCSDGWCNSSSRMASKASGTMLDFVMNDARAPHLCPRYGLAKQRLVESPKKNPLSVKWRSGRGSPGGRVGSNSKAGMLYLYSEPQWAGRPSSLQSGSPTRSHKTLNSIIIASPEDAVIGKEYLRWRKEDEADVVGAGTVALSYGGGYSMELEYSAAGPRSWGGEKS